MVPSLLPRKRRRRPASQGSTLDTSEMAIDPERFFGEELSKESRLIAHRIRERVSQRIAERRAQDSVWTKFRRQAEAFEHADRVAAARRVLPAWHPDLPQIFAMEYDKGGVRKFIAATYSDFWARYCLMSRFERVYYEVIREGRPCLLYFDIEFNKELNPDADGDAMVSILKEELKKKIASTYGILIPEDGILDLDSSTAKKFSRHLIVHMGAVFENTSHARAFVESFCADLQRQKDDMNNTKVKTLFVRNSKGTEELFIDRGVYTRNRCFRLLHSTKLRKNRFLRLAEANMFSVLPARRLRDSHLLFFSSLVTHISATPLLGPVYANKNDISTDNDTKDSRDALRNEGAGTDPPTPVQNYSRDSEHANCREGSKMASIVFDESGKHVLVLQHESFHDFRTNDGKVHWVSDPKTSPIVLSASASGTPEREMEGRDCNSKCFIPTDSGGKATIASYPLVDQYVLKEARKWNAKARIKSKHFLQNLSVADHPEMRAQYPEHDSTSKPSNRVVICFGISGSRYCGNIGREHKSNGIYYVAAIPEGVVYQKCHDPECRRYRSKPVCVIPSFAMDPDLEEDMPVALDSNVES